MVGIKAKDIKRLSEEERERLKESLTDADALELMYDWEFWARDEQIPPDDFFIWLILSGRGWGKSLALNHLVIEWAKQGHSPIGIIGQNSSDVRDTIVEVGDSSILKISDPRFMPEYEPSKKRLTFPNGVQCLLYYGDEPDQLRGANLAKAAVDELCKFQKAEETWANLMMALRAGTKPQVAIATTPRPIKLLKELVKDKRVHVTRGHTLDNKDNLAPEALAYIVDRYQGTKLGRQELAGEILDTSEGMVYDAFNREMCVIPRFAIPSHWARYTGHDFGRNNAAVLWTAQDPDTGFFYHYRTYKGGKGVSERVADWKDLSANEMVRRSVGGSHQEEEIRTAYTLAGWHIAQPAERRIETQVLLVNELHRKNMIYVFSDLDEYLEEKSNYLWEVDKEDNYTGKIHNESQFHYCACERYNMSEFKPVQRLTNSSKPRIPIVKW